MQADSDTRRHESDDENDSLFGSPPPSPGRMGRSRSPSPLAFPSGSSGSNSAQNVGTLALPGSHLFSELPSAYKPLPTVTPTPVLQQQRQSQQPSVRNATDARSGLASTSRVATPIPPPASRAAAKPRKSSKKARTSSTPRPTPPPIPLPNPSDPPPSNFLRNQQALLGLAGLVSGVRPANLALQNTRGSTATNPIVVEDEDDRPTIGRHPPASAHGVPSAVNLPVPSSDAILQTLINQKNVFPVVDALLRLASNGHQAFQSQSQPQYSAFRRQPAVPPPAKKRKLSSVPAGASDWDVPYPFLEGQGPADYRNNWERQRSRQLLVDLIGLVKNAARKAAAKNYYQSLTMQQQQMLWEQKYGTRLGSQSHAQPKVFGHYRPETLHYGLPPGQAPQLPPGFVGYPGTPVNPIAVDLQNSDAGPSDNTIPQSSSDVPPMDSLLPPITSNSDHASTLSLHLDTTPTTQTTNNTTSEFPHLPISDPTSTFNEPSSNDLDDFLTLFNNMPQEELEQIFSMPAMDFSGAEGLVGSSDLNEFASFESLISELGALNGNLGNAMEVDKNPTSAGSTSQASGSSNAESQVAVDPSVYTMDPSLLAIDPALVALSFPSIPRSDTASASMSSQPPVEHRHPQLSIQPNSSISTTLNTGAPPTPTLIGSPLSPRALSETDHGPQTPNWDTMFGEDVEIINGDEGDEQRSSARGGSVTGEGKAGNGTSVEGGRGASEKAGSGTGSVDVDMNMQISTSQDKGKGKEVIRESGTTMQGLLSGQNACTQTRISPVPRASQSPAPSRQSSTPTAIPLFTASQPSTSSQAPPEPTPTSSANPYNPYGNSLYSLAHLTSLAAQTRAKTKNKDEILKRARAMKAQLVEEIQRAKVELWEMTMEAGCLSLLAKEKSLDPSGGGS
ncbi:hypothetical protein QCA50_006037 [Cerrena zonata]|uniref:Uncharacterized protein n=1 Tax=Cerrena zonata TaxID=2478898 RepID=A0AAW0GIE2_9APHY